MRPQAIRAVVTLTISTAGVWACATATTGETSEDGSGFSNTNPSTSTSSGGASSGATSLVTNTSVGPATSTANVASSTTAGTTTGAASTTGASTTSAPTTTVTSTTATATTATSTTSSNSSSGCEGSGITAAEPIEPSGGWVPCGSNSAGIEGAFFTFSDSIASSITPANFEAAGTEICVTGEAGQVVDGNYDIYGAGVGFNFADEQPWNATAAGVKGVQFNMTAMPAGAETRIIFTTAAGDHCKVITGAGTTQTVMFADTTLDCWETGGAKPAEAGIVAVKWQIATDSTAAYPFDFCIEGFAVVP